MPPTPKVPELLVFIPLTWFSTLGVPVGEGESPSMPNVLVVATVPCLRRLMPGDVVLVAVFVLPKVVFPLISRQTVALPEAEPESTRIPARAAVVVFGAAAELFKILVVWVQLEFRARA